MGAAVSFKSELEWVICQSEGQWLDYWLLQHTCQSVLLQDTEKVTHMHLSECECVKVKSAWCLSILKSTCINMCEAEVCSTKVL